MNCSRFASHQSGFSSSHTKKIYLCLVSNGFAAFYQGFESTWKGHVLEYMAFSHLSGYCLFLSLSDPFPLLPNPNQLTHPFSSFTDYSTLTQAPRGLTCFPMIFKSNSFKHIQCSSQKNILQIMDSFKAKVVICFSYPSNQLFLFQLFLFKNN